MAVVDQKTKNIEHLMSNIEILGRPLYLPVKNLLHEQYSPLVQIKSKPSKTTLTYTDLQYERDEKDWWWCDDV